MNRQVWGVKQEKIGSPAHNQMIAQLTKRAMVGIRMRWDTPNLARLVRLLIRTQIQISARPALAKMRILG
jgi:hypothetical protein